ncbi:TetR/AcrR family transcriptional regulator [Sulfitobacter sp. F26169L]|uniref:TetR/AcrR family transcriptional regulator n=1 Tax=Sulfitobacter sp. F26169L TaxID=2996015 RepID=UPI002261035C|nr:TetR/AcrR family transcriptional regulator [Sulfitobacter sp. F26169L]MCX7567963.1 TetR/AcrR family transcriptional regulator [Sulfitobacter sp. F26169L]
MATTTRKDAAYRRAARKSVNHGAKRARILEVAGDLFFRQGYGNTSIDEIAAELGVGKPYVYYYFRDKLTIFETLCVESSNVTHKAFEATRDTDLSASERLSQGLRELILRYLQTFAGGALYYKEPGLLSGEAKDIVRQNALALHADLLQVLEEGRTAGEFSFDDTKLTALMIGGAIGFMFSWYRPDSKMSPTELADYMVRDLMKIVAVPG